MLYWLTEFADKITFLNVFRYLTVRTGGAMLTALVFVFLFGPAIINLLRLKQGKGQPIRDDGPKSHLVTKTGTPTMGGLMILSAVALATMLWANPANPYVWLVLGVTLAFGAIFRTANDAQWHSPELADDGRVRYRFRGEVSALLPPDPTGCTVAPLSNAGLPATIQVSYLSIDYRQAPPRYEVSGTSWWEVQTTCPPPLPSGASLMEAVWLSGNSLDKAPAFGELSGNGSKIEGGGASPGGNWHWCFVAKGSAASCPP